MGTNAQCRELSEDDLLRAVLEKQPGAWGAFYERYERLMLSCIRKVMHRYTAFYVEEDLEGILNGVCLNLVKDDFKKLRTFDPERGYKLSSWVGLIATNTALDALRRREPIHARLDCQGEDDAPLDLPDPGADPGERIEHTEEWEMLLRAIGELGETDRRFMELYYVKELEPDEIAAKMGISVNTVYSRKNKVREKLRRIVESMSGGKMADAGA